MGDVLNIVLTKLTGILVKLKNIKLSITPTTEILNMISLKAVSSSSYWW